MSRARGSEERGRLAVLSRPPEKTWPDGVVHHGARLLVLLALAAVLVASFPPVQRTRVSRFTEGSLAEEDVIAEVTFAVPKSDEELESDREEARAAVPPTFDYRPEAVDSVTARLERFFEGLDSVASGTEGTQPLRRFLSSHSIELGPDQLGALRSGDSRGVIRSTALRAARQALPEGVADSEQLERFGTSTITVREGPDSERSVPRDEVLTPRAFFDRAVEMLPPSAPPNVQEILRLVLIQHLEHSLELNVTATQQDREGAAQAVSTTKGTVLENEQIVEAQTQITEAEAEKLRAYEDALRNRGMLEEGGSDLPLLVGQGLLDLLILSVFGLGVYFFRREVYTNFRWIVLIALLMGAYFGVSLVIARQDFPFTLLPVAFVTLAVAVLWDARIALVLAAVLAVLTGVQPPFADLGAAVVPLTFLGGAAAALSVRAVRRRAQTWLFGAVVAGAYAGGIVALVLVGMQPVGDVGGPLLASTVNAVLSAVIAMGFIPVFELFTGITTDQTLLEWADPNRPLLKRLSMEAPGTYAHTINVANLAEAAAGAVGANGLLCRVGLYYHDVGKMLKPHYFVENQPDARNPHDRLKPDTSAAIVKEHVTEGYRLACEENVPDVVTDFILEHHGTQRIGFFWEKAKEEYGEGELDVEDFTYPGPKPQSKETAIAMLADSVESATRALQDPTPERVRDLIENIVDGKIADGQLDESPLTLREIRRIKEQFIKVLSGIYHHRIDYPQTRHLTDRKVAVEGVEEPTGTGGDGVDPKPAAPESALPESTSGASAEGTGGTG